jgi:hypothetical protein
MSSSRSLSRRSLLKTAAVGGGALLLGKTGLTALPNGPSTAVRSYLLPSASGVQIRPILTTGDTVNDYHMCGIPDGLGALARGGTFELFMNHEITAAAPGIVRAHGSNGAFVSKWTIDRSSLRVLKGEDLTKSGNDVHQWNGSAYFAGTTQWQRLCSADLPDEKALRHGNLGTEEQIFFNGEEITFGRAWARIVTGPNAGQAWELPRLGKMSFENVVACPHGKENTIVALFDDGNISPAAAAASNPSEVFIYIGKKQSSGNEIERAGLTNGKLYSLRVYRDNVLVTGEDNDFGLGNASTGFVGNGRFELVEMGPAGDVSAWTGLQLEQDAIAKNIFRMQRPEDGAWDPRGDGKGNLYFVTTGEIGANTAIDKNSRLWRLAFKDIDDPLKGGKIEILLTGKELPAPGWRMFDNITIDRHGRLLLQEDTGNNPWVARIWLYSIDSGRLTEVAHHDPELFQPTSPIGVTPVTGGPNFITQDEESSGIIDAEQILGRGWFLLAVQNHKRVAPNPDPFGLVEGGQLLAMYVDPKLGDSPEHDRDDHRDGDDRDNDDHHDH